MSSSKRSKTFQQLEEGDMDEDDFIETTAEWKNASKADKSRLAAKYRRDKEAEYLDELAHLLPFPGDVTSKLDKASILRLTITYLQLKKQLLEGHCKWDKQLVSNNCNNNCYEDIRVNGGLQLNEAELMMQALGGFVIFISRRGRILYVSENVLHNIGFSQADMIGNKVTMFLHPDDRREVCKQFSASPPALEGFRNALPCSANEEGCLLKEQDDPDCLNPDTFICERSPFYLRMRYQVTKRGTKTKHTGFLLTQWSGRIQLNCNRSCDRKHCSTRAITGMVALCRPLQSSNIMEIRLDGNMFMSRHNMDLKYTFCDPRILTLVGYEPTELLGRTVYDFHNPFDAPKIRKCHSNLIDKGQSVSKYYRFLGKTGEWVWMQTRATIIYNTSNEPQYVVCMNYVIGQDEGRRHLMMEQEDLKDQDIPKGVIDVTSLSSPGPAHSSGYCSADEDHSYSSSKTRETYSPGIHSPGAHSSLDTGSQPHTPPTTSPGLFPGPGHPNMVTPTMLEEKMQEFEDLNLFDIIEEMLPPQTSASLPGLPPGGQSSLADSWIAGLDNDIEMMDVDQNSGLPTLEDATDRDGLLVNLLKDTEKRLSEMHQPPQGKIVQVSGIGQPPLGMMVPPSTSAVITQSNVMLSSATLQTNGPVQTGTTCSKSFTGIPHPHKNGLNAMESQPASLPMALVNTSLDSGKIASAKANVTVSAFPPGMLGGPTEGSINENPNDFAIKFAENTVDEQINATLASYFGDGDTLMDSSTLGVQDTPLNGLNDNPFNLLEDTSSLSSYLRPSLASSASSSAISSSASSYITSPSQLSCSSYQRTTAASGNKESCFATPKAPTTTASHSSHHGVNGHVNKSNSVSNASRTMNNVQHRNQPAKVSVQVPQRQHHQTQKSSHNTMYPGLDDHRYTNKQLDSPPHSSHSHKASSGPSHRNNGHKSNSYRGHHHSSHYSHSNGHSHGHHNPNHQPLLLEKFLLTKEKLNPNKGSEAALATRGISQLHLGDRGDLMDVQGDGNQQLLKKLLTEELHPKDMQKAQQEVIMDRRQSAGSSPTCSSPTLLNTFSLDADDLSQSIQLLGEDTSTEMDKLWAPPGGDETIPSELDEILREEMRQNDLWLQHCINELL